MQIIEMTNPASLEFMPVRELFRRAFEWAPSPWTDEMSAEIARELGADKPWLRVLAATDGENLQGLSIIALPSLAIMPKPQVFLFYCEGGPAMRNALIDKTVELIKNAGYTSFMALIKDNDGRRMRAFKRAGTMKEFGSAMEFDLA